MSPNFKIPESRPEEELIAIVTNLVQSMMAIQPTELFLINPQRNILTAPIYVGLLRINWDHRDHIRGSSQEPEGHDRGGASDFRDQVQGSDPEATDNVHDDKL